MKKLAPYEETTIVVSMTPFLKTLLRITFLMPAEGQKCTAKHIVRIFAVSVMMGTPWFIGLIGFLYKELQSELCENHCDFFLKMWNFYQISFNGI